ncbi:hypothetical protein CR513_06317, partial [Mucuna pruriens]
MEGATLTLEGPISREERRERHERHRRDEKRERRDRREEDRRDKLEMRKCKIPQFVRNCKPEIYIDWELKVEQVISSFDIQGQKGVRLVTLAYEDYALIWWTSMMDRVVNCTTSYSPFAQFVKELHVKVCSHIEKKVEQYAERANKDKTQEVFEEGDLVWVHLRNEWFPNLRKSKLLLKGCSTLDSNLGANYFEEGELDKDLKAPTPRRLRMSKTQGDPSESLYQYPNTTMFQSNLSIHPPNTRCPPNSNVSIFRDRKTKFNHFYPFFTRTYNMLEYIAKCIQEETKKRVQHPFYMIEHKCTKSDHLVPFMLGGKLDCIICPNIKLKLGLESKVKCTTQYVCKGKEKKIYMPKNCFVYVKRRVMTRKQFSSLCAKQMIVVAKGLHMCQHFDALQHTLGLTPKEKAITTMHQGLSPGHHLQVCPPSCSDSSNPHNQLVSLQTEFVYPSPNSCPFQLLGLSCPNCQSLLKI